MSAQQAAAGIHYNVNVKHAHGRVAGGIDDAWRSRRAEANGKRRGGDAENLRTGVVTGLPEVVLDNRREAGDHAKQSRAGNGSDSNGGSKTKSN